MACFGDLFPGSVLSVPCTRQLQEAREKEKKEFTVLAEFSSVVADTQQYIVDEEQSQGQSQVTKSQRQSQVSQSKDSHR